MCKQQIKEIALAKGFKLKEQPNGEMDLNPYVYQFAVDIQAKAIEDAASAIEQKVSGRVITSLFREEAEKLLQQSTIPE